MRNGCRGSQAQPSKLIGHMLRVTILPTTAEPHPCSTRCKGRSKSIEAFESGDYGQQNASHRNPLRGAASDGRSPGAFGSASSGVADSLSCRTCSSPSGTRRFACGDGGSFTSRALINWPGTGVSRAPYRPVAGICSPLTLGQIQDFQPQGCSIAPCEHAMFRARALLFLQQREAEANGLKALPVRSASDDEAFNRRAHESFDIPGADSHAAKQRLHERP